MQNYTRRQLKEDKFVTATSDAVHWSGEHRPLVIVVLVVVVGALAATAGASAYLASRDEKASLALGEAIKTYNAPLRPADAAPQPEVKSFTSIQERAKTAHSQFLQTAADYSRTRNGRFALYMAGITAIEMGDGKQAEDQLQQASSMGDKELSTLAKFALASLARNGGKEADALKLYKEVIEANTVAVPKVTAQFELASMYEIKEPAEAAKIYEEIQKEESASQSGSTKGGGMAAMMGGGSRSPAFETASKKLEALKPAAPSP